MAKRVSKKSVFEGPIDKKGNVEYCNRGIKLDEGYARIMTKTGAKVKEKTAKSGKQKEG